MGLIEETVKMRRNQDELIKRQQEVKELEKQKEAKKLAEQEKKQYNKDLLKTYEKRLQMIFNEYFEKERTTKSVYHFAIKKNS